MRFVILFLFSGLTLAAQVPNLSPQVNLYGYIEPYYCYDVNQMSSNTRSLFYSHNRHNEVNINLGLIGISAADSNYRANFALMAGTYTNANMINEPGVLKNIYEANAGIKLSRRKSLWLDAGVFSSHIGFESAIGKNCWSVTRSILADNTPYFESGVKLTYTTSNEKWSIGFLVLNGWQRIQRVDGNSLPSFGTQIVYNDGDRLTINSSTFIGTDSPDSTRTMRYFHNFYATWQVGSKLGITTGLDYGLQQSSKGSISYNSWAAAAVIARISLGKRSFLAVRGEYYIDEHEIIIYIPGPDRLNAYSYSVNFDYEITKNVIWRLEARAMHNEDSIFLRKGKEELNNYFFTTVIAVSI